MAADPRKRLYFTFGNHMHWVDMQWLWGYQVLPDSIDDMLALCAAVGAKGNVNFDAVGYEKLAAEDPSALERLRAAIAAGEVEVVGGSYGQPYGLFLGGESNIRQRVFGARAVRRLLGVWPRTFWEEEFDFFPQLPQILSQCGFTGASLFFQWTWHTPTVPEEDVPLVIWEGADGTRLPTVAKTALCLHQWPEDFDGKLELALATERPALVQWLELMPSPDWMCRSEVLLPRLRELFSDSRFDVEPVTLGELIAALADREAPVRHYTMDDVFHGMTIGKNGDRHPFTSDRAEDAILAAEGIAATLGLCGRPYASWDVYPAWEIDEAWRELLQGQHHDNHECEGLCGSVGRSSMQRARSLADAVHARCNALLAARVARDPGDRVVRNHRGWTRNVVGGTRSREFVVRDVPPHGWRTFDPTTTPAEPPMVVEEAGERITLTRRDVRAQIARETGCMTAIAAGDVHLDLEVGALSMRRQGEPLSASPPTITTGDESDPQVLVDHGSEPPYATLRLVIEPHLDAANLTVSGSLTGMRPDGGFEGALRLRFAGFPRGEWSVRADTPFAADTISADGEHVRKYPTGDWMTSPQRFETVRGAFTSTTFVDLLRADGSGLLIGHASKRGWFRTEDGVEVVLNAYDPWDEDHFHGAFLAWFLLFPHGPLTDAERFRLASEVRDPLEGVYGEPRPGADLPAVFGGLSCEPDHVLVTAFHREHGKAFEHVPSAFDPGVRNPYVVRLVEFDGRPADVVLKVPGRCPSAARTDLLGSVEKELLTEPCEPPEWSPPDLHWSALRLPMRPREIATVMLDLEAGRHRPRNLDEHRSVWATVHRRGS